MSGADWLDPVPFDAWEPGYERIRADFGYDRTDDERARDRLAALTTPFEGTDLRRRVEGARVAIVAPGPPLDESSAPARLDETDVVVAASTAAERVRDLGMTVDCQVTDLDGAPAIARSLTERGVPVAVHAHGDNREAIDRWVPQFEQRAVLPTTQVAPRTHVHNVGGFTDGDRAAFLSHALGAGELRFVGWDLDDPAVGREKRRKLDWAARLLRWLEVVRDERFGVLDGRRDDVEPAVASDAADAQNG